MFLLLFAGCPKSGSAGTPFPTLSAADVFAPGRYDYVELESHAGLPPMRNTITETWTRATDGTPPDGLTGDLWVVENYGLPPMPATPDGMPAAPQLLGTTRYVMGAQGLAHYAITRGPFEKTYAPKFELQPEMKRETTWTGTHGEGADQNTRTCHVEATPFCAEGVAVTCETAWTGRSTWMRQHWCKGVGWVGYEAVRVSDGVTTTSWTEEVARDGVALPGVGLEQRPLPEVVIHPAGEPAK